MDEHIGLTARVAEQILQRPHLAQLTAPETAAGTAQRLHNILAQFPALMRKPQAQTNVFQLTEAITRIISKWPQTTWTALNESDATASIPQSSEDGASLSITQLYMLSLLQLIFSLRAQFTAKQIGRLDAWAEELRTLCGGEDGELLIRERVQCVKRQFNSGDPFADLRLAPFTVPGLTHAQLSSKSSAAATAATAAASSSSSSGSPIPFFFLPRTACPLCHRTQPFYCTHCYEVIHPLALQKLPQVQLSLQIDIVLHPAVLRHKSTALQTLLLVQPRSNIAVHTFPALPAYDPATTVVMFPSEQARTIQQIAKELRSYSSSATDSVSGLRLTSVQRVVFLEGTWGEGELMLAHPKLSALTALRLDFAGAADSAATAAASDPAVAEPAASSSPSTAFWRYQRFGPSFLSSIEAVFHTLKQLHTHGLMPEFAESAAAESKHGGTSSSSGSAASSSGSAAVPSTSRFDNVLWLFAMSYERVRAHYRSNPALLPPPVQS